MRVDQKPTLVEEVRDNGASDAASQVTFEFDEYAYSRAAGLQRRGEPIALPRKIAAALALLVARDGGLVTRDELADAVWGDRAPSDDSIARCLYQLRRLVPLGDGKLLVRTVHGSGFRFAVPLRKRRAGGKVSAQKLLDCAPSGEPFDLLQQARELVGKMMAHEVEAALAAVDHVLDRWPNYAPAWSFRADLHLLSAMRWFGAPRDNALNARLAAERAIALDAEYAPGWAVLGAVAALVEDDVPQGLACLERAIVLDGDYFMARGYHALALLSAGECLRAREEARRALARNSLSSRLQIWYPWTLFCSNAVEEALAHLEAAVAGPFIVDSLECALAAAAACVGQHDRALEVARHGVVRWRNQPWLMAGYAYVMARAGDPREAERELPELAAREGVSLPPSSLAPVYVALGRDEAARACVDRAYRLGDPFASHMPYDPRLAPLRLPRVRKR